LLAAADLQDHLMVASNDLERLQRLLDDASETLSGHFYGASSQIQDLMQAIARCPTSITTRCRCDAEPGRRDHRAAVPRHGDPADRPHAKAPALLRRPNRRDAMGEDDEDGCAIVEDGPGRPNPVTQDEMDAGSIELF
jgi:hypothetical protein